MTTLRERAADARDYTADALADCAAWFIEEVSPPLIVCAGVLVGAFVVVVEVWDRTNCRQSAHALAVERRYDFPSGCYYRIDGRWIPADTYRAPEQVQR